MRASPSGLLAALILASAVPSFAQTPPSNDAFANRIPLSGSSITFTGTLAGATLENQETSNSFPYPTVSGGTVWWAWTASESTRVVVEVVRDSAPYVTNADIVVYSGDTLVSLSLLDENAFSDPPGRYVSFAATAGTSYQFQIRGGWNGSDMGGTFTLRLTATNPPVFITQPKDCVVSQHGSAFFCAMASGPMASDWLHAPPTSYQWLFNGSPIPGETFPSLVIHYVTANQAGSYSVVASNIGGIMESAPAMLTISPTNPAARLMAIPSSNPNLLSFSVTAETARWYKLESSPDLKNWGNPVWLQLTNTTLFTVPGLGSSRYIRASFDIFTDMCVAQLKQMRWAAYMAAIERRLSYSSPVGFPDLRPYIPLTPDGIPHTCPAGGTYATGDMIIDSPTCTLSSHGHTVQPLP